MTPISTPAMMHSAQKSASVCLRFFARRAASCADCRAPTGGAPGSLHEHRARLRPALRRRRRVRRHLLRRHRHAVLADRVGEHRRGHLRALHRDDGARRVVPWAAHLRRRATHRHPLARLENGPRLHALRRLLVLVLHRNRAGHARRDAHLHERALALVVELLGVLLPVRRDPSSARA